MRPTGTLPSVMAACTYFIAKRTQYTCTNDLKDCFIRIVLKSIMMVFENSCLFSLTAGSKYPWYMCTCRVGICGWGNNESETYTSDNVLVENGNLILEARKSVNAQGEIEYTSGRINSDHLVDIGAYSTRHGYSYW